MTVHRTEHDQHLYDQITHIIRTLPADYDKDAHIAVVPAEDQLYRILRRFTPGFPPSLDVGPGWLPLILKLNRKLTLISPNYTIAQVKEKFGTLRFYADFVSPPGLNSEDFNTLYDIFHDLIRGAEAQSSRTCEVCARTGAHYVNQSGYHRTVCDAHQ